MGDERSFGQVADQLHRPLKSEKVNLLQVPEQFVHVDVRVDELELSGFDFRQVEDIVDQLQLNSSLFVSIILQNSAISSGFRVWAIRFEKPTIAFSGVRIS